MKKEIWKDIDGYEGLYLVSNKGNIKSLQNYGKIKERIMKLSIKRGYYEVGLRKKGIKKYYLVHRLVAKAFIENTNNFSCINHIDENKLNNNIENLEWCNHKYNNTYGSRLERVAISNKLRKEVCKLDEYDNVLETYNSIAEASRNNNISISCISMCVNKKRNKAGGYTWKYKSEVMCNA